MLKEIYTAALGMMPQQTQLELTANNIANANTVGFKRLAVFEQSLIEARQNMLFNKGEAETTDAPMDQFTDFSQGSLQRTDNPLDLALGKDGFFILQDADGNETFTRTGHFQIDESGVVVSDSGKALQSDKGSIIVDTARQGGSGLQNDKKSINVRIGSNGEVYANEQMVGKISVVKVDNPQTLERTTGMEFSPTDKTDYNFLKPEEVSIKQGFLEGSNVNIITEMISMINLQRSFEMGHRVITTNDGTLEKSIDIGRMIG